MSVLSMCLIGVASSSKSYCFYSIVHVTCDVMANTCTQLSDYTHNIIIYLDGSINV